jgi:hypothetical protein
MTSSGSIALCASPWVRCAPFGGGIGWHGLCGPDPEQRTGGLAELRIEGLQEADARALLDSALTGPLDMRVRDQLHAETRGNPLALLELPRGLISQQLAGRFRLPSAMRLSGGIDETFRRRSTSSPTRPAACC